MSKGMILVAHGAADPRWAAPFEAIWARTRALRPDVDVRLAYLERMTPDLAGAGAALADAGCVAVQVLPLFLGAGGHVRKDLPQIVAGLRAAHPAIAWSLAPAAGEHPLVIEALAQVAAGSLDLPP